MSYDDIKMDLGLPKANSLRLYTTKTGDRTLTPVQKRKVKEEQNFKCAKCGKKFPEWQLHVHHKKGVAKHKNSIGLDMPVHSMGKKIKPKSDKRSNLEAVCIPCHNEKAKKKTAKKTTKRKTNNSIMGNLKW